MAIRPRTTWMALGALALALFFGWFGREDGGHQVADDAQIEHLYEAQRSGVMVEATGIVAKLLPDDLEGSRHQRFIVRLDSGHTVLVSHNIDVAPRASGLRPGAKVGFRGQYEWNPRGGVVHWTHRDPRGERSGGWLQYDGRTYR